MKISKERLRQIILEEIQGLFEWPHFKGAGPALDDGDDGDESDTLVMKIMNEEGEAHNCADHPGQTHAEWEVSQ